ncbi:hypothetical protein DC3_04110 [Deinococcus cellulosilyticus NBRC 106333 = KACC 11606]|uniref:Uncharacterized protein n=1 Tax=Deinococcus cellulosilyticus (strain DSM 18568 / NBRC 106333 / KACC 11606 / 5516J-15) TaxID=1223518 RepID=A0A511MXA9_DEIC1|nr:hypothetical protein DC3_04110 [Deinococcus cellulosilyticus NBRC 106333 = KACC 11606]
MLRVLKRVQVYAAQSGMVPDSVQDVLGLMAVQRFKLHAEFKKTSVPGVRYSEQAHGFTVTESDRPI